MSVLGMVRGQGVMVVDLIELGLGCLLFLWDCETFNPGPLVRCHTFHFCLIMLHNVLWSWLTLEIRLDG